VDSPKLHQEELGKRVKGKGERVKKDEKTGQGKRGTGKGRNWTRLQLLSPFPFPLDPFPPKSLVDQLSRKHDAVHLILMLGETLAATREHQVHQLHLSGILAVCHPL
jgi:hypothetical protein